MKKGIGANSAERLAQTVQGRALLKVIEAEGSPSLFASRIGVDPQLVRQWVYKGEIPACRAMEIGDRIGLDATELRPDLTHDAFLEKVPEPPKVKPEPVARTEDARLLVRVASKLGGVEAACKAIFCTVDQYRNWKSRGRIPAIKLPTVLALDQ